MSTVGAPQVLVLGFDDDSDPVDAVVTGYFAGNLVGNQVLVRGTGVQEYVDRGLILLLGVERARPPEVAEGSSGMGEPDSNRPTDSTGPERQGPSAAPAGPGDASDGDEEGEGIPSPSVTSPGPVPVDLEAQVPGPVQKALSWIRAADDLPGRRARATAALVVEGRKPVDQQRKSLIVGAQQLEGQ